MLPTNTQTKTSQATTVAASVMLAVSATALVLSWGMLAALVGIDMLKQQTVHIASVTSPSCENTWPYAHGKIRVIAILATPQGGIATDWDRESVKQAVFGTINDYYQKNSYYNPALADPINGVKLVGEGGLDGSLNDVYPRATVAKPNPAPYTVTVPTICLTSDNNTWEPGNGCKLDDPTACNSGADGTCVIAGNMDGIAKAIIQATDSDIRFEDNARILVFMHTAQGAVNLAAGGDYASIGSIDLQTNEGSLKMGIALIQKNNPATAAHELGHTLGVTDTSYLDCKSSTDILDDCDQLIYGDPYEMMSSNGFFWHSNAYAKATWGWLQECPESVHKIQTITQSGDYYLRPIEDMTSDTEPQALKILHGNFSNKPSSNYLYIEYRQNQNLDSTLESDLKTVNVQTTDIFQGALLHLGGALFDPYQPQSVYTGGSSYLSALPFGQVYTDQNTHTVITIGPKPALNQPLKITVGVGARTDFNGPINLQLTPTNQSGSTDCQDTYSYTASADDPSGISKYEIHVLPSEKAQNPNEEVAIIEISGTTASFEIQREQRVWFRVYDNTQAMQGGRLNNYTDSPILLNPECILDVSLPTIEISSSQFSEPITLAEASKLREGKYNWDPIVNIRTPIDLKFNFASSKLLYNINSSIVSVDGDLLSPSKLLFSSGFEDINEYTYTKNLQKIFEPNHNYRIQVSLSEESTYY